MATVTVDFLLKQSRNWLQCTYKLKRVGTDSLVRTRESWVEIINIVYKSHGLAMFYTYSDTAAATDAPAHNFQIDSIVDFAFGRCVVSSWPGRRMTLQRGNGFKSASPRLLSAAAVWIKIYDKYETSKFMKKGINSILVMLSRWLSNGPWQLISLYTCIDLLNMNLNSVSTFVSIAAFCDGMRLSKKICQFFLQKLTSTLVATFVVQLYSSFNFPVLWNLYNLVTCKF